jgi:hypothetical protein
MTPSRYCGMALRRPPSETLPETQTNGGARAQSHALLLAGRLVICSPSRAIVPRDRSTAFPYPSSVGGEPL